MSFQPAFAQSPSPARDREVIRVDFSNDSLGIAENLRRAFASASHDQCTRDFEELLDELN